MNQRLYLMDRDACMILFLRKKTGVFTLAQPESRSNFLAQQVQPMAVSIRHFFPLEKCAARTLDLLFAIMGPLSWSGPMCEAVLAAMVWCSIFFIFYWVFVPFPTASSLAPTSILTAPPLTSPLSLELESSDFQNQ